MEISGDLSQLIFFCSKCDELLQPRHIRKRKARCPKCKGTSWRMNAIFVNRAGNNALNVVGLTAFAVLGAGFKVSGGRESQFNLNDVSREAALMMCKKAGGSGFHVKKYIEVRVRKENERNAAMHREKILDAGGGNCQECNILFTPDIEKPWTGDSFCSLMCWAEHFPEKAEAYSKELKEKKAQESKAQKKKSWIFTVSCSKGHEFETKPMYIGTVRKCTECDEKVLIERPPAVDENDIKILCSCAHTFYVNPVYLNSYRKCPECNEPNLIQEQALETEEEIDERPTINQEDYFETISEISNMTLEVIPDHISQCSFYISCDGENLNYFVLNEEKSPIDIALSENAGQAAQKLYLEMASDGNLWKEASINLYKIDDEWRLQSEFA